MKVDIVHKPLVQRLYRLAKLPYIFLCQGVVHHPPDPSLIFVAKLYRQEVIGKPLVTNGPAISQDRTRADGSVMTVCRRWIRPAMMHGRAHLDPRWIAVDDDPTYFLLQNTDEISIGIQVLFGAVDRCAQVAFQ